MHLFRVELSSYTCSSFAVIRVRPVQLYEFYFCSYIGSLGSIYAPIHVRFKYLFGFELCSYSGSIHEAITNSDEVN